MSSSRLLAFSLLVIACSITAFALPASLSDQGTGVTYNGAAVSNGNLTITIWTDPTSTASSALVFNRTYANAIVNGSWNVLLNDSVLDLEFGRKYYKDYAINNVDLDFGNSERLPFYSSVGALGMINSSIVIGTEASVFGNGSIAIGLLANATADESVALGISSSATGYDAVSIGPWSSASAPESLAFGYLSRANMSQSAAIGPQAIAAGLWSLAFGDEAFASADGSIAIGSTAEALGVYSIALGSSAQAYDNAIAIGEHSQASEYGIALGLDADANNYSIALGMSSGAWGTNSTALGVDTAVSHNNSIAFGTGATTTTNNQFMVGSASYPLNTVIHGSLNITDVLILKPGSAPASPVEGTIYFDSTAHKPCYYNSTGWVTFDGSVC